MKREIKFTIIAGHSNDLLLVIDKTIRPLPPPKR